jgi:hypothetical protein
VFSQQRSIVQRPWFIPACAAFAVVCWIATAASQSISRAPDSSAASFTLSGEIPAHSALRATAHYTPSGSSHRCNYPPALLQHDSAPDVQAFNFEIALSYSLPDCEMLLSEVSLVIDGFHGEQHALRSSASGGVIAIRPDMSPRQKNGVPGFPASGAKEYRGVCSWRAVWAAEGQAEARRLECEAADKDWKVASDGRHQRRPGGAVSRQQLAGKTIRMTLRMAEPAT